MRGQEYTVPEQANHSCYHGAPYRRHAVMSFRVAIFRGEKVRLAAPSPRNTPTMEETGIKKSMILNRKRSEKLTNGGNLAGCA